MRFKNRIGIVAGTSCTGKVVPIVPGGRSIPLLFNNRTQYFEQSVKFRLQELNLQVAAVREGMANIIPVPLLSLITANHMEQLVCGMSYISVALLRKVVRYDILFIFNYLQNISLPRKVKKQIVIRIEQFDKINNRLCLMFFFFCSGIVN